VSTHFLYGTTYHHRVAQHARTTILPLPRDTVHIYLPHGTMCATLFMTNSLPADIPLHHVGRYNTPHTLRFNMWVHCMADRWISVLGIPAFDGLGHVQPLLIRPYAVQRVRDATGRAGPVLTPLNQDPMRACLRFGGTLGATPPSTSQPSPPLPPVDILASSSPGLSRILCRREHRAISTRGSFTGTILSPCSCANALVPGRAGVYRTEPDERTSRYASVILGLWTAGGGHSIHTYGLYSVSSLGRTWQVGVLYSPEPVGSFAVATHFLHRPARCPHTCPRPPTTLPTAAVY